MVISIKNNVIVIKSGHFGQNRMVGVSLLFIEYVSLF